MDDAGNSRQTDNPVTENETVGPVPAPAAVQDEPTVHMGAAARMGAELNFLMMEVRRLKEEVERTRANTLTKPVRLFDRWPRLTTLEAIPSWIKNFDRRCHALRLLEMERFQGAMSLLGDQILTTVSTALPQLNDSVESAKMTWSLLRQGLLQICSGEHPVCYTFNLACRTPEELVKREAPLDECWAQICGGAEDCINAINAQFHGNWSQDTFRRVLVTSSLLRCVSVNVPSASDPFAHDPEKLFRECRAATTKAGCSVTMRDRVDEVSSKKRDSDAITASVLMTKSSQSIKCFRCDKLGHIARECRAVNPQQPSRKRSHHTGGNDPINTLMCDSQALVVKIPRLVKVRMMVESESRGPEERSILLDSCSSISLISPRLTDSLNLAHSRDQMIHRITGSVPGTANTKGGVRVTLRAQKDSQECVIPVYLHEFDCPGADILLGNDMLTGHKFILNYKDLTVSVGSVIIPMEVDFVTETAKCHFTDIRIQNNMVVEPWAQRKVVGYAAEVDNACFTGYVHPCEAAAARGVLCARGYPEFWGGYAEVLIVNASDAPVFLKKGEKIGTVSLLNADEAESTLIIDNTDVTNQRLASNPTKIERIPDILDLNSARNVLSRTQFQHLVKMLQKSHKVWRDPYEELGAGIQFSHTIDTGNARPLNSKPRRLPLVKVNEARTEVERMLRLNVIEPTNSPWGAPIVLVTKKDGSTRFCVDYRRLNDVTKADVYPLPRCDDLLSSLHGKKFFSAIDLESGYWQIPMAENDKEKTAFLTPFGAWQFKVMPFGLRNAPSTFQRTMDMVLAGAKWNHCLVYIDDILIFSETAEDHITHLGDVFERLIRYNLKLKPSKCDIFKPELLFLGHLISENGIKPNPQKVAAIMSWPEPSNSTEVESFLGLCGYYRKFIANFSILAKPLFAIKNDWSWGDEQRHAFSILKHKLANPILLRHPRPADPFVIETDASRSGLGAVLLQADAQGQEKPVEFASRLLRKHERNYPVRELEALGILWGCETFRHWLLHQPFVVRTDHQSLVALEKVQDGRLERWKIRLRPFQFGVQYKRGKTNIVADCLSRSGVESRPERVSSEDVTDEMTLLTGSHSLIGIQDVRAHQKDDVESKYIFDYLLTGVVPSSAKSKRARFVANASTYALRDGILYKGSNIVLPRALRTSLLEEMHNPAHFGADKLLPSIRTRFWWPGMSKDVRSFCGACVQCARATPYTSERLGLLKPIQAGGPWATVAMDLAGPYPQGEEEERYVLVIMDHFTKYVILVALRSKHASIVARKVYKYLICNFGCPHTIITDNGTEFRAEFDELCTEMGIQHSCVLPYHQQANGLVERYMQSLNKIIRIVTEDQQVAWPRVLCTHAFAYNSSYHPAIMNTPYFLNFGRDPRIPVDNRMEVNQEEGLRMFSRNKAVEMAAVMAWTAQRLQEYQDAMKQRYDASQKHINVEVGDIVFIRNEGILPKTKMRWSKPCRVLGMDTDGLRVRVVPLHNLSDEQTVSIQRVRPYNPSPLNPMRAPTTPPQKLGRLSTLGVPVDSEEELGSFWLPSIPTDCEVQHGSHLVEDIRQRCPTIEVVDGMPALENGNLANPSVVSPPDVRQSHLDQAAAVAKSLLLPQPEGLPVPSEVSGTTVESNIPDSTTEIAPLLSTPNFDSVNGTLPVVGIQAALEGIPSTFENMETTEFSSDGQDPDKRETSSPLPEGEFVIESLLDCQVRRGYPYYRVRWAGHGPDADSWEPIWGLPEDLVHEFDALRLPRTTGKRRSRQAPWSTRFRD